MNTYWNGNGKYEVVNAELEKLIPIKGEVENPLHNKKLERFRKASNCYYDLYNNGLGNRAAEFRQVFGFSGYKRAQYWDSRLLEEVEAKMDSIIEQAAQEQGLGHLLAVTTA